MSRFRDVELAHLTASTGSNAANALESALASAPSVQACQTLLTHVASQRRSAAAQLLLLQTMLQNPTCRQVRPLCWLCVLCVICVCVQCSGCVVCTRVRVHVTQRHQLAWVELTKVAPKILQADSTQSQAVLDTFSGTRAFGVPC